MAVTCSANLLKNMYLYYYAKKYSGFNTDWGGLSSIAVNSTLMALVLLSLRPLAVSFCSLAGLASLGIAVYVLASWVNKAFNSQERAWVNRVAPWPVFVF